jgi:hypothetical protein
VAHFAAAQVGEELEIYVVSTFRIQHEPGFRGRRHMQTEFFQNSANFTHLLRIRGCEPSLGSESGVGFATREYVISSLQ